MTHTTIFISQRKPKGEKEWYNIGECDTLAQALALIAEDEEDNAGHFHKYRVIERLVKETIISL